MESCSCLETGNFQKKKCGFVLHFHFQFLISLNSHSKNIRGTADSWNKWLNYKEFAEGHYIMIKNHDIPGP